jgi:hypothetical protein
LGRHQLIIHSFPLLLPSVETAKISVADLFEISFLCGSFWNEIWGQKAERCPQAFLPVQLDSEIWDYIFQTFWIEVRNPIIVCSVEEDINEGGNNLFQLNTYQGTKMVTVCVNNFAFLSFFWKICITHYHTLKSRQ